MSNLQFEPYPQVYKRKESNFEFRPEHILGAMMELRDYAILDQTVTEYLGEHTWSYVVRLLETANSLEEMVPGCRYPSHSLRRGILRDGLIFLLKLQDFQALDVDFLSTFSV